MTIGKPVDVQETKETTVDKHSGLEIRKTDNTLKEGDLPGINQEAAPLEIGEDGLPVGWTAPEAGESE